MMRNAGIALMIVGSAVGLAVALYNYFSPTGLLSPLSATAGSPGALLVIGSTLIMLLTALALGAFPQSRLVAFLAFVGIPLDIAGTGFAAVLLDSPPLLGAMLLTILGWLAWAFGRRRTATA